MCGFHLPDNVWLHHRDLTYLPPAIVWLPTGYDMAKPIRSTDRIWLHDIVPVAATGAAVDLLQGASLTHHRLAIPLTLAIPC